MYHHVLNQHVPMDIPKLNLCFYQRVLIGAMYLELTMSHLLGMFYIFIIFKQNKKYFTYSIYLMEVRNVKYHIFYLLTLLQTNLLNTNLSKKFLYKLIHIKVLRFQEVTRLFMIDKGLIYMILQYMMFLYFLQKSTEMWFMLCICFHGTP